MKITNGQMYNFTIYLRFYIMNKYAQVCSIMTYYITVSFHLPSVIDDTLHGVISLVTSIVFFCSYKTSGSCLWKMRKLRHYDVSRL